MISLYRWYFKPKNIKKIPKREMIVWSLLTCLLAVIFAEAFVIPKHRVLDSICEKQVVIEKIETNSYPRHRMLLHADGQTYYMSYSSHRAKPSIRQIREDLKSGVLSVGDTVTIQFVSADDILLNFILQKKRIVDLRTEDTVYYDLDTEKKILTEEKAVVIVVFFPLLLLWTAYTVIFLLLAYDIVGRRRLTKSERKRMREKGK
jgi:uncharacterized protein (UPF0218 family)